MPKEDYLRKQEVLTLWGQIVNLFAAKGYVDQTFLPKTGGTIYNPGVIAPLTVKGGTSSAGIQFQDATGKSLGSLNAEMANGTPRLAYFNGTSWANFWTNLNSNKYDVDWTCRNITVYGWLQPYFNNSQDIGEQDHVWANLYIDNLVTPAGNGMRFGANNGPFRWYSVRGSWSSNTPTMELSKTGDLAVKMNISSGGNMQASGGVSAGGICDLSIN